MSEFMRRGQWIYSPEGSLVRGNYVVITINLFERMDKMPERVELAFVDGSAGDILSAVSFYVREGGEYGLVQTLCEERATGGMSDFVMSKLLAAILKKTPHIRETFDAYFPGVAEKFIEAYG